MENNVTPKPYMKCFNNTRFQTTPNSNVTRTQKNPNKHFKPTKYRWISIKEQDTTLNGRQLTSLGSLSKG